MFTKRYPIEPHGRKRLTVSAGRTWSEVVVRLDGVELGRTDREGLLKGVEYPLRDHTSLRLWLEFGYRGAPRLFLTRNGRPLPGSAGDPSTILWTTLVIVWFFAALQLALAVLVISFGYSKAGPVIFLNLGAGLVLALLGVLAWRRSMAAMVIVAILCFGEIALFLVSAGHIDAANIWRVVVGIGIVGWLLKRAIVAIHDLKQSTLPIRHPPEPMHQTPPHPPEHDGLS